MNNRKIMSIISGLINLLIAFEIGDMSSHALMYTTTRGQALRDGMIILICILARFLIDRYLIGRKVDELRVDTRDLVTDEDEKEEETDTEEGFSPLVLDVVIYVLGTILLIILLRSYDSASISISLAVMLLSFMLMLLCEKDIHLGDYIDRELEGLASLTADEEDIIEAENKDEEHAVESDKKEDKDGVESDKEEVGDRHRVVPHLVNMLSQISFFAICDLVLIDIYDHRFSGPYILIIILLAVLIILFNFISRATCIDDCHDRKYYASFRTKEELIFYIIYSLMITIFICQRSVLVGLVYLLGAAVCRIIIPAILDNWGRGGTLRVAGKKIYLMVAASRIFSLIIIMIAVWLLSYGAVWETEYLTLIALSISTLYIKEV